MKIPTLFPLYSPQDLDKNVIELRQWFRLDPNPAVVAHFASEKTPGVHPRLKNKAILCIGDDGVRQSLLPPINGSLEFGLVTAGELVNNLLLGNNASTYNIATWNFFQKLSPDTPVVLKWH